MSAKSAKTIVFGLCDGGQTHLSSSGPALPRKVVEMGRRTVSFRGTWVSKWERVIGRGLGPILPPTLMKRP
jgi:hypothetical protein